MQSAITSETLTWAQVLNVVNTALIALVGFFAKEAWRQLHNRMDAVEDGQGDMRERVASLETATGWNHPHRRRTDSGAHRKG